MRTPAPAWTALAPCCLALVSGALVIGGLSDPARAQVYKYEKPDGTIVFTDKLSELPPERRAYYNKKLREQEAARRRAEEQMTAAERQAKELEEERRALLQQEIDEADRKARLARIDAAIQAYREEVAQREQRRGYWLERKAAAEKALAEALEAYRAAQKEWEGLAIRARYALLPGQQKRIVELEKALPELAAQVEAANTYLTETLPEEARKAGFRLR